MNVPVPRGSLYIRDIYILDVIPDVQSKIEIFCLYTLMCIIEYVSCTVFITRVDFTVHNYQFDSTWREYTAGSHLPEYTVHYIFPFCLNTVSK